jgi:L-aminopeptidase/D-esterase-like protein
VSLTAVDGVRVGHWTDGEARTGCTVVLLPPGTVASGEVRGSAPATRELALLAPECTVQEIHAVVLSGGSAFGLAAGSGVADWLSERDVGFETRWARVPIVVGLACFDLGVGDPDVRPDAASGRAACEVASAAPVPSARVGAGTGCTVGKWGGPDEVVPSGLGSAIEVAEAADGGELLVAALLAVNAVGFVGDEARRPLRPPASAAGEATTIGVIVTNARLDKVGCLHLARSGHDGLARAIEPVHTSLDGDALVACATGAVAADADLVRALAARAVEAAVLAAPLG